MLIFCHNEEHLKVFLIRWQYIKSSKTKRRYSLGGFKKQFDGLNLTTKLIVQANFDKSRIYLYQRGVNMIFESFSMFLKKVMFFTAYVNNASSFPKPLNSKQEAEYLKKFHDGDMEAKNVLIHHNLRLVAHIVKKYSGSEEADDLISAGSLGLIKAINTYKDGFNTQFSTYASRCIENEILMLLRVNKKHKTNISIEEALGGDGDDNEMSIIDVIEFPDCDVESQATDMVISKKLGDVLKANLTEREYTIMNLRYGLNGNPALTQREVSKHLNISRSYVSRLEKKSIETLQDVIKKEDYM